MHDDLHTIELTDRELDVVLEALDVRADTTGDEYIEAAVLDVKHTILADADDASGGDNE